MSSERIKCSKKISYTSQSQRIEKTLEKSNPKSSHQYQRTNNNGGTSKVKNRPGSTVSLFAEMHLFKLKILDV